MERFVAGDIVVVPFPFTDLSFTRKRPALVLADLADEDLILCEITSRPKRDNYSITLEIPDLDEGKLKLRSTIRPNRLLTINKSKIDYKFGKIKQTKLQEVLHKLKYIFNV